MTRAPVQLAMLIDGVEISNPHTPAKQWPRSGAHGSSLRQLKWQTRGYASSRTILWKYLLKLIKVKPRRVLKYHESVSNTWLRAVGSLPAAATGPAQARHGIVACIEKRPLV